MKQDMVMRFAIWLVEVSSSEPDGEAFAGDLLELFAAGRSRWWCFAQSLRKTMWVIEQRLRSLLVPVWYSIGFVLLHPLWQRLYAPSVASFLQQVRGTSQWPGSAVLEMIAGLLPAVLFVWLGIFIYSLLQRPSLNIDPVVAFLSLNVGACLLFLAISIRLNAMPHDLRLLSRADFYYPLVHARFSILLFPSLLGAVLVLPYHRRPRHQRHDLARMLRQRGSARVARSRGFEALLGLRVSAPARTPQGAAAERLS